MDQEIRKLVQNMDLENIENQLALQCAPLIAGLRISSLLAVSRENLARARELLRGTGISCTTLLKKGARVTVLVYNRRELGRYLEGEQVLRIFAGLGYREFSLNKILPVFRNRYRDYMENGGTFPHEMGLLLGYPAEDVEGYLRNDGRNFLCIGDWKVYENPSEKRRLFRQFETARETLVCLVANGIGMTEILENYREGMCF